MAKYTLKECREACRKYNKQKLHAFRRNRELRNQLKKVNLLLQSQPNFQKIHEAYVMYRREVSEHAETKRVAERRMKQIQHLLVENAQLTRELEQMRNEYIKV